MKPSAEHAARLTAERERVAHAFGLKGPIGNLSACRGTCACGKWEMPVPRVGAYGWGTNKARLAQVKMGHAMHLKSIRRQGG